MFYVQVKGWDDQTKEIKVKNEPKACLDENTLGGRNIKLKNPEIRSVQRKTTAHVHQPLFDFFEFKSGSWESCSLDDILNLLESKKSATRVGTRKDSFVDYLRGYTDEEVNSIYCDRFFFDILLGGIKKGMSDIDKIIVEDEKYILVEVKNKTPFFDDSTPDDLSKASFGWDTRRLAWYLFLKNETELNTLLVVAEIDDKINRNIKRWKSITINHWCNCSSWGSDVGNTQMAPYTEFKDHDMQGFIRF